MEKWEYLVVYLKDSAVSDETSVDPFLDADKFTEQLNKYGQGGWELVSFEWEMNAAKAAFKRKQR